MSQRGCGFRWRGAFADLPFRDKDTYRPSHLAHTASCPTRRKSRRDGAASVVMALGPAPHSSSKWGDVAEIAEPYLHCLRADSIFARKETYDSRINDVETRDVCFD